MDYDNLVRDFAHRTLRNLEVIEATVSREPDAEVYEVTQLINSMLGLLVFPQQMFFNRIPQMKLEQLREQGWPVPMTMKGTPPYATDLRDLVRCLRNGISHFNIEFTNDGPFIQGVRLWNDVTDSRGRPVRDSRGRTERRWEAEFKTSQLRVIANRFAKLLLEIDA